MFGGVRFVISLSYAVTPETSQSKSAGILSEFVEMTSDYSKIRHKSAT